MFSGEVNMCRNIVTDRIDRKTKKVATWTIHQTVPALEVRRVLDQTTAGMMIDHFSNDGRPLMAMR
jgi:hypothetical protein